MILRGIRGETPCKAVCTRARGEEVTSSRAAVHSTMIEGRRGRGSVFDTRAARVDEYLTLKNSASTPSVRARRATSFRAPPRPR